MWFAIMRLEKAKDQGASAWGRTVGDGTKKEEEEERRIEPEDRGKVPKDKWEVEWPRGIKNSLRKREAIALPWVEESVPWCSFER